MFCFHIDLYAYSIIIQLCMLVCTTYCFINLYNCSCNLFVVVVIVFALYSLCVVCPLLFVCCVLFERLGLFCVTFDICVLCLIAVTLPPGENYLHLKLIIIIIIIIICKPSTRYCTLSSSCLSWFSWIHSHPHTDSTLSTFSYACLGYFTTF
jgi:hypothetical protein